MTLEIHEREERRENGQSMMLELAEEVEEHYTHPSPAAEYRPTYFPEQLDHGLFWGLFLGALLGILLAWLVHNGWVTPTGWEGLFSLVPFSFYAFWAFVGGAVGLAVGGVIALLATAVPALEPVQGSTQEPVEEEEERTVIVRHE
jgi:hypothetical protein